MPDSAWLSWHVWRSYPGCYSLNGPGIIGPLYTTTNTTYRHIGPAAPRSSLSTALCLGRVEQGILSNKWFGEHWHWLYESHLWATMQLQLISFVLIILHCMEYTGGQQHSSSRHRQHKREYQSASRGCPVRTHSAWSFFSFLFFFYHFHLFAFFTKMSSHK